MTVRDRLLRTSDDLDVGMPMSGLVLRHDLWTPNLLKWSEAFDNAAWAKTRSYVAANVLADPITGLYTVDKLVEDGTAANTHFTAQTLVTGAANTYVGTLVLKAAGRTWARVLVDDSGWAEKGGCDIDLDTGALSTITGGTTATSTSLGDGWYRVVVTTNAIGSTTGYLVVHTRQPLLSYSGLGHQGTAAAGGSTTTAVLAAGASAVDDVYNATEIIFSDAPTTIHTVSGYVGATKTATFTPARAAAPDATTYTVGPGIYVARAQLSVGTTLPAYVTTTDLQSLAGSIGATGVPLIQGIATANTTNDFTWLGNGASFVTDDLGLTANLTGITMAGAFTLYIAGKFNGTAGTVLSLAGSAGTTDFQRIAFNGSGKVRIGSKAGAAAETNSADLTVATDAYLVLELKSDGTTLTLTNLTTLVAVTLASQAATGNVRLGVGCNALSTIATIADAMTVLSQLGYGRALSSADRGRVKRTLVSYWAAKGVTVL